MLARQLLALIVELKGNVAANAMNWSLLSC